MVRAFLLFVLVLLVGGVGALAYHRFSGPGAMIAGGGTPSVDGDRLVIRILYGSEKQNWFEQAIRSFNEAGSLIGGQRIVVEGEALGSLEGLEEVFQGNRQAHLLAPASTTVLDLANVRARRLGAKDLLGDVSSVARSPVVIAMWRKHAEALGWPSRSLGWGMLAELSGKSLPGGRRRYGLGRTQPEYSSSGLQSVLAVATVVAGGRLTSADVWRPEVEDATAAMERGIVHFGSSTGFLAKRMAADGPDGLTAAVVYENLVVELNRSGSSDGLVAIYPSEGTMWCDHPVGVVDRPWVDAPHRAAAKAFIAFLREPGQQRLALACGFRPVAGGVGLGSPISAAYGVDPEQPAIVLPTPAPEVTSEVLRMWRRHKRPSHVVIALDLSGSMKEGNKAGAAQAAASGFVDLLGDADTVSLLGFGSHINWLAKDQKLAVSRSRLQGLIASLRPAGGTALYDGIHEAVMTLQELRDPQRLDAVVVLSDGTDTSSTTTVDELMEELERTGSGRIRVFTMAYGSDADLPVLRRISEVTGARGYESSPETIRSMFRDVATFF